jgi:ELWxxDGT repeat protein
MKKRNLIFLRTWSFLIVLTVSFCAHLSAQTKPLGSFKSDGSEGISEAIESGGLLFFTAFDDVHGRELWCTDGTNSGTRLVKDINPGTADGAEFYFEFSSINHNGILFFKGDDGVNGSELWRSDGTDLGTYIVKNISSGSNSTSIGDLTSHGNKVYFVSGTSSTLWKSDGTETGTQSIRSFQICRNLVSWNGALYFSAAPDNTGEELWTSNGTAGGTVLLRDLNGATGASLPTNFHSTPSNLFFTAITNDGWELWKTNGTFSGTVQVSDINSGGASSLMTTYSTVQIVSILDTVFFRANNGTDGYQFWKSDGTTSSTIMLTSVPNGINPTVGYHANGGNVMLSEYGSSKFMEYNPTTTQVSLTDYPVHSYFGTGKRSFIFNDGLLYYATKDTLYGCEMSVSDGTVNGSRYLQETHLLDYWYESSNQTFNRVLGIVDSKIIFTNARGHYRYDDEMFSYDDAQTATCFAPSVLITAPSSGTSLHLLWNRITDAEQYEIEYRPIGQNWMAISPTDRNYHPFGSLQAQSDYEFRIRANCGGNWTVWSDVLTYNTEFLGLDDDLRILAECSQDETTQRIYWLKNSVIESVRVRYRDYSTANWIATITDSDGIMALNNLTPSTFYEYETRVKIGGVWQSWTNFLRYFHTSNGTITSVSVTDNLLEGFDIYPNPSDQLVYITTSAKEILLTDISGKEKLSLLVKDGNLTIDVSGFSNGVYLVGNSDGRTRKLVIQH